MRIASYFTPDTTRRCESIIRLFKRLQLKKELLMANLRHLSVESSEYANLRSAAPSNLTLCVSTVLPNPVLVDL